MKIRQLGSTDLMLSEVGIGTWAIGGPNWAFGWGPQNDAEAIAAIRRSMELEVNWIDTAAVYGLGYSEELVAKAVKGHRKEVIIATKCSLVWDEAGNISSSLTAESVKRECEMSLKRLNTDFIDLYQIHWPNDEAHIEDAWEMIQRLREEGKIRYGGVSNFQVSHLKKVMTPHVTASLQPPYSMLRRDLETNQMDYCRERRIGIIPYSPMQSGLLTGKFNVDNVAANDWRLRSDEFKEPNLSINLEFVEGLKKIAANYDKSVAQLSIAWVLRLEEISSAIVGARRPSQIEETVAASGLEISEEDLDAIETLLKKRADKVKKKKGFLPG